MDGSSPIVYVNEGITSNILFFLEGEGVCNNKTLETSLDTCVTRSLGYWGSSTKWPTFNNFYDYGMLDYNVTTNKFRDWTKVVIMGCDGGGFQGNNVNPVKHNGSTLYFRGSVNMRAIFKWANDTFILSSGEKIVMAGSQTGGLGVYLWIDYLKGLVSDPSKVYAIVDSAIYMIPEESDRWSISQLLF